MYVYCCYLLRYYLAKPFLIKTGNGKKPNRGAFLVMANFRAIATFISSIIIFYKTKPLCLFTAVNTWVNNCVV